MRNLLAAGRVAFTTSGRAALALALQRLEIRPGDEVLLPAFHCIAMSGPVRSLGAVPVFYCSHAKLDIDLADFRSRITSHTRCAIVVHFFGFPQDLAVVRETCQTLGVALIEDCAHSFYSPAAGPLLGSQGDFAIGSLMKFFPVFDGGCLVARNLDVQSLQQHSGGLKFQLKAALDTVERATLWSDKGPLAWLRQSIGGLRRLLRPAQQPESVAHQQYAPNASAGDLAFEPAWTHVRMSRVSRWVLCHADHRRNIALRRQHFLQYLSELTGIAGARPLHSSLPEGVVPYVFPLLLQNPRRSFQRLRDCGVPLHRWEDVDVENCPASSRYRESLVQLPCHASLSPEQIAAIIANTVRVLNETSHGSDDS